MRDGARELDDVGRPVLAAGGDGRARAPVNHLPLSLALPPLPLSVGLRPQEVAGGRRGATCQSPVNHPRRRGGAPSRVQLPSTSP